MTANSFISIASGHSGPDALNSTFNRSISQLTFKPENIMHTSANSLQIKTIIINRDIKRFSHIKQLNPIPTNCIIDKTLPGLGATHNEICELRNSIIILPNVATILGKHKQHMIDNSTFAVYEKVTKKDLIAYMRSITPFKKILTTPEGFIQKVKPVLGKLMYADYFLLLDECHKYITDIGYRKDIALPMDDFFQFKGKAMISATALIPSDPRFKAQRFKLYKVKPNYNYRKEVRLIKTYHTLHQLLMLINEQPSQCYCIFFNSIQGITSAIQAMQGALGKDEVMEQYQIFCGKESAEELSKREYKHAWSTLTSLSKYNFFTSSFYNGLDIYYEGEKAAVIIVSDASFAEHSIVNPEVDVVQIRGRFRPVEQKDDKGTIEYIDWVDSFTHIVRTNRHLPALNEGDAELKIAESKLLYEHIKTFHLSATQVLTQQDMEAVLHRVSPYSKLLDADGKLNGYKVDNYLLIEQIKYQYKSFDNLKAAYERTQRFVLTTEATAYLTLDSEGLTKGKGRYSAQNYLDVTNLLWELEADEQWYSNILIYKELWQHYELIVRAYFTLGIEYIDKLGFQHRYIQTALRLADSAQGRNKFPVIDEVQAAFQVGKAYQTAYIKKRLQEIFKLFHVPGKADGSEINRYFEVEECQLKRQRAFRILRPKHTNAYQRV
jgi:hypothetical protein